MFGKITNVVSERSFGFIESETSEKYFFHRAECPDFDALAVGSSVSFTPTDTPKGKRAVSVTAVTV